MVKAVVSSVAPDGVGAVSQATIDSKSEQISIACTAIDGDVAASTTYAAWVPRYDITLVSVHASVQTAPTGQAMIVDIHAGGTTVMSTNKITIDAGETDTSTAATAPALTTTDISADTEILIIADQVGSSVAGAGLVVDIVYNQT